jgi:CTP synthase (UTP-ammonia lyase)
MHAVVVTVLMDLPPGHRYHVATLDALGHAAAARGIPIDVRVVRTDTIRDPSRIAARGSAVVIGPGSPYRDQEAAHAVVREARERNIPLVGT